MESGINKVWLLIASVVHVGGSRNCECWLPHCGGHDVWKGKKKMGMVVGGWRLAAS